MNRIAKIVVAVFASAGLIASAAACGGGQSASAKGSGTINVVASVNQWGTLAEELGGKNVEVASIVHTTNVDPHDYEPTTADISKLQKAQVIVVNGADYDAWAVKAAKSTKATVVNAAEVGGVKKGGNPHIWFSSSVRKSVAAAVTKAYEQADASKKADFDKLNEQWQNDEDKVESKIAEVRKKAEGLNYAATESVAYYLAEDMGLKDATPAGYAQASANESEPTASDIKQYVDILKSGGVDLLVVNTQEESNMTKKLTDAAESANVPEVKLTEQMPSQYDSLTDWMSALVDSFNQAV